MECRERFLRPRPLLPGQKLACPNRAESDFSLVRSNYTFVAPNNFISHQTLAQVPVFSTFCPNRGGAETWLEEYEFGVIDCIDRWGVQPHLPLNLNGGFK
jgi:hypothetical protein